MSQKKIKLLKKYLVKNDAYDKVNVLKIKTGIDKKGNDTYTARPFKIRKTIKEIYKNLNWLERTKLSNKIITEL
jgi:hypothetical protein